MNTQLASPSETALELAMRFHEAYERLAPSFGYETRAETRNFGDDPKNANLMVAVCAEILALRPQEAQPVEASLRGLLREWQRMYNAMDSKHEDKHPSMASFKDLRQRTHAALAEPSPVAQPVPASPTAGEPIQCGWIDEFGNVFPMGAWNPNSKSWRDAHKTIWHPVYRLAGQAPSAEEQS